MAYTMNGFIMYHRWVSTVYCTMYWYKIQENHGTNSSILHFVKVSSLETLETILLLLVCVPVHIHRFRTE